MRTKLSSYMDRHLGSLASLNARSTRAGGTQAMVVAGLTMHTRQIGPHARHLQFSLLAPKRTPPIRSLEMDPRVRHFCHNALNA